MAQHKNTFGILTQHIYYVHTHKYEYVFMCTYVYDRTIDILLIYSYSSIASNINLLICKCYKRTILP